MFNSESTSIIYIRHTAHNRNTHTHTHTHQH